MYPCLFFTVIWSLIWVWRSVLWEYLQKGLQVIGHFWFIFDILIFHRLYQARRLIGKVAAFGYKHPYCWSQVCLRYLCCWSPSSCLSTRILLFWSQVCLRLCCWSPCYRVCVQGCNLLKSSMLWIVLLIPLLLFLAARIQLELVKSDSDTCVVDSSVTVSGYQDPTCRSEFCLEYLCCWSPCYHFCL